MKRWVHQFQCDPLGIVIISIGKEIVVVVKPEISFRGYMTEGGAVIDQLGADRLCIGEDGKNEYDFF